MDPERWRRIEKLYESVVERSPAERAEVLAQADPDIRAEVEVLLAQPSGGALLDQHAPDLLGESSLTQLSAGARLGPYQITRMLGRGGMGEVYAARDTRLGRMVAIKILPSDVAQDRERKRRFLQEARAASALNHPNIVTLHDMGSEGGVDFLVMEYVQGKTLGELIPPNGLGINDALQYAIEIAGALAKAHAAGIIHRDLKSGNVMVTAGVVKVLDFGLAKLTETAEPGEFGSTAPMTSQAMIVGTVAYMSPEQAQGKHVDARSDIFSFGVMLYEMLSGRRPFQGANRVSTLAAILQQEPKPLAETDAKIPSELERVVLKCLRKDPERRFQGMADVRVALEEVMEKVGSETSRRHSSRRWPLIAMAICSILAVAGAWLWRPPALKKTAEHVMTKLTATGSPYFPAVSPDGKMLAYTSNDNGFTPSIWVQQVFGGKSIRITHEPTDGFLPVFSPDGTMIAFRSQKDGGGIYEVPALGGEPRLIVSAPPPSDPPGAPKYTPDGSRVLFKNEHNHLCMVPREGGKIVEIQPEFEMTNLQFFALSPDGKKVLTTGYRNGRAEQDRKRWWLISIPDGKLEDIDPPNQDSIPLVWVTLWKDLDRQWVIFNRPTGDSYSLFRVAITSDGKLARNPEQLTLTTGHAFSPTVSEGGRMVFSSVNDSESLWSIPIDTDRAKVTGERQQLIPLPGGLDPRPSLSRDGKKVTYMAGDRVVVVDLATRQETQLATGRISSISPDGLFVVYTITDGQHVSLHKISTVGGSAHTVCHDCASAGPVGFSSDGSRVLAENLSESVQLDRIQSINISTGEVKEVLSHPKYSLYQPCFSWDDKWMTFLMTLDDSHARIYITPTQNFVPAGENSWIALTSGEQGDDKPRLSPDGNTLYFSSSRDGYDCFWAQRLNPKTKHPVGAPFAIQHFHDQRNIPWAGRPLYRMELNVARDKIVTVLDEFRSSIWMMQLEPAKRIN